MFGIYKMGTAFSICDFEDDDDNPTYCISLECVSQGTNGCFIFKTKNLVKALLKRSDYINIEPYGQNTMLLKDVKDFLKKLSEKDISFKVFNSTDGASYMNYIYELNAVATLREIIGPDLIKSHTTFEEILGITGFTSSFNTSRYTFKIRNRGWGDADTIIYVLLLRGCQEDIYSRAKRGEPIDYVQLVNDLLPVLSKMHSKGYAHMDIKPGNIVYCADAAPGEATYRLVDFESMHIPGYDSHAKSTLIYKSPALGYNEKKHVSIGTIPPYMKDVYNTFLNNFLSDNTAHDENYIFIKADDYAIAQTLNRLSKNEKNQRLDELISDLVSSKPFFLTKSGGRRRTKIISSTQKETKTLSNNRFGKESPTKAGMRRASAISEKVALVKKPRSKKNSLP